MYAIALRKSLEGKKVREFTPSDVHVGTNFIQYAGLEWISRRSIFVHKTVDFVTHVNGSQLETMESIRACELGVGVL